MIKRVETIEWVALNKKEIRRNFIVIKIYFLGILVYKKMRQT